VVPGQWSRLIDKFKDIEIMIGIEAATLTWSQWQSAIVILLRADLPELATGIDLEDVDWPSWRSFYNEGRSPRAAIDRALERDL
jgi:hypothetical protein